MQIPTVKVSKDGDEIVVNECDLADFEGRGWQLAKAKKADKAVEPTTESKRRGRPPKSSE